MKRVLLAAMITLAGAGVQAQPLTASKACGPSSGDPFACDANTRGVCYTDTSSGPPHTAKLCDGSAWVAVATGTLNPFSDSTAIIKGSADATKLWRVEVDGFTTGTTRVFTPPNANLTITASADRTVTINGNPTLDDWFDQGVKTTSAAQHLRLGLGLAADADAEFLTGTAGAGTAAFKVENTMTGASATSNWLNITGTLPATLSAETTAVYVDATGAGSSAQVIRAALFNLGAGFTGNAASRTIEARNLNRVYGGTIWNADITTQTAGVDTQTAISAFAEAPSVANAGAAVAAITGLALGNSNSEVAIGAALRADGGTGNVGVWAHAGSTGTRNAAGFFTLSANRNPYQDNSWTTAALRATNGAIAADIFCSNDNGTDVYCIKDDGLVATGSALKTLERSGTKANITEGSAQAVVRIALGTSQSYGALVTYTVTDDNGTDFIVRNGTIQIQGANKAGTATCTIAATRDQETEDGSEAVVTGGALTLTYTWTNVVSTTRCDLSINGTSSAGTNTFDVSYKVILTGTSATTTITPQ